MDRTSEGIASIAYNLADSSFIKKWYTTREGLPAGVVSTLQTDLEGNTQHDQAITHHLYGGDKNMRIQQEIVLGIGGVRALHALGLKPSAWHINE